MLEANTQEIIFLNLFKNLKILFDLSFFYTCKEKEDE